MSNTITSITLLDSRLQYIGRQRSVVHATSTGTHTMCGVPIDETMQHRESRMVVDGRLCQRCYRSLRTYGPQFVKIERKEVE